MVWVTFSFSHVLYSENNLEGWLPSLYHVGPRITLRFAACEHLYQLSHVTGPFEAVGICLGWL